MEIEREKVDQREATWHSQYKQLLQYLEKNGHCDVKRTEWGNLGKIKKINYLF